MNRDDNRLDDLIRNRLEHFSPEPSPQVWERVQGSLSHKQKRERPQWFRWAAAAAVLLAALVTGILFMELPRDATKQASVETPIAPPESGVTESGMRKSVTATQPLADAKPLKTNPDASLQISSTGAETPAPSRDNTAVAVVDTRASSSPFRTPSGSETKSSAAGEGTTAIGRFSLTVMKSLAGVLEQTREITRPGLAIMRTSAYPGFTAEEIRILTANARREDYQSPSEKKAWKVGMHLAPAYSSYSASHTADYSRNMTRSGNSSEGGVGGGISVQYKASDHWRIESGMYYARSGDKSENSGSMFASKGDYFDMASSAPSHFNTAVSLDNGQIAMNSTAGVINFTKSPQHAQLITLPETAFGLNTAMLSPGEFYQVFDFMEIPVTARYRVFTDWVEMDLVSGISTNLVIGNNVYMGSGPEKENIGYTRDISTFNFSGIVGVGLIYPLGKNIALTVEPRANYYFNSLSQNNEVNFRPWKVGVYTGLTYEF